MKKLSQLNEGIFTSIGKKTIEDEERKEDVVVVDELEPKELFEYLQSIYENHDCYRITFSDSGYPSIQIPIVKTPNDKRLFAHMSLNMIFMEHKLDPYISIVCYNVTNILSDEIKNELEKKFILKIVSNTSVILPKDKNTIVSNSTLIEIADMMIEKTEDPLTTRRVKK